MSALPEIASDDESAAVLRDWLALHRRVFVLTGAGCSTASGIPDYRDRNGEWKRTPPITLQALTGSDAAYRRYWARSSIGWPRFLAARPNAAHRALAELEARGTMHRLLTQNVDGLHQRAGNREVIDLHGRLDGVVCLGCGARSGREAIQADIEAANADWIAGPAGTAPDGDADLDDDAVTGFRPPWCEQCGGQLKPDVVFFGENVPRQRVADAQQALQASDALLVVGSSLMVWSGLRFVRMAATAGLPIAILNRGRTRADELATLRLDAEIATTLHGALQ
ncbi:NAD-dependent protein deacetylase [Luteimonas kalidii]|uniref:NAD-dependent protein deacetylase n=1 Tax=Luteimonas kalidii TaxID=3042025 RepID=A0ABT6JPD3_9GAMM|nr:NAD-dependent protein deacetylase [Luteimonas kalidii]MDH5832469.1 NAD-dependent protein deacetylase [Luteimonas kalidii]